MTAQGLAIVLSAGLDAVLVAIDLALESGAPGKVSVEHGDNVLNRLNAQPVLPTAGHTAKSNHAAAGGHGALRQSSYQHRRQLCARDHRRSLPRTLVCV